MSTSTMANREAAAATEEPPIDDVGQAEINGNWDEVRMALDNQQRGLDADALLRAVEANSMSAQVALFGGAVQLPTDARSRSLVSDRTRGGTVARAFWWGFHIQVSREDVQQLINGFGGANTFIGLLAPIVPPVIRPFLAVVRVFLEVSTAVLRALDRGRGVYISMSWFAPGIFVPTSV
jgi:hypothetical protein